MRVMIIVMSFLVLWSGRASSSSVLQWLDVRTITMLTSGVCWAVFRNGVRAWQHVRAWSGTTYVPVENDFVPWRVGQRLEFCREEDGVFDSRVLYRTDADQLSLEQKQARGRKLAEKRARDRSALNERLIEDAGVHEVDMGGFVYGVSLENAEGGGVLRSRAKKTVPILRERAEQESLGWWQCTPGFKAYLSSISRYATTALYMPDLDQDVLQWLIENDGWEVSDLTFKVRVYSNEVTADLQGVMRRHIDDSDTYAFRIPFSHQYAKDHGRHDEKRRNNFLLSKFLNGLINNADILRFVQARQEMICEKDDSVPHFMQFFSFSTSSMGRTPRHFFAFKAGRGGNQELTASEIVQEIVQQHNGFEVVLQTFKKDDCNAEETGALERPLSGRVKEDWDELISELS